MYEDLIDTLQFVRIMIFMIGLLVAFILILKIIHDDNKRAAEQLYSRSMADRRNNSRAGYTSPCFQRRNYRTNRSANTSSTTSTTRSASTRNPSAAILRTPVTIDAMAAVTPKIDIPEKSVGPVNYYANTRHNQSDNWFQFEYRLINGEWLSYILRMPSLEGRDQNLHITHRYSRGGSYWVCYDPQPKTLDDAKIVSKAWADRELEYISTGIAFEQQNW